MFNPYLTHSRTSKRLTADIVVIGGGATGVGIARDAAMRGFRVILIEKEDLGSGTSGRFHGLLHSGARYVVDDPETAAECIKENRILRRIASPAIVDTGGLFLALDDQELAFSQRLVKACKDVHIPISDLSLAAATKQEPRMVKAPVLRRVLQVPDAYVNGATLLNITRRAAESAFAAAQFLTNHQVVGFHKKGGRLESVVVEDTATQSRTVIECGYVINAAGVWGGRVSRLAGITIEMVLDKGTMIMFEKSLSQAVLNRCRPQSDGDIVVPAETNSILGTTAVQTNHIDNPKPMQWEIDLLLREGEQLIPGLSKAAIKRVYSGVRPLFGPVPSASHERSVSRSFRVLDHADEGIHNFISVVGGKVTLYRRMAEAAVDVICQKQATHKPSRTAEEELVTA